MLESFNISVSLLHVSFVNYKFERQAILDFFFFYVLCTSFVALPCFLSVILTLKYFFWWVVVSFRLTFNFFKHLSLCFIPWFTFLLFSFLCFEIFSAAFSFSFFFFLGGRGGGLPYFLMPSVIHRVTIIGKKSLYRERQIPRKVL